MTDHAIASGGRLATQEDEDLAELIEAMRQGVASAAEIYRPGEFWDGLIATNLEMLRSDGVANFKRTVSNNYYNWLVTSPRDPQIRNALLTWLRTPSLRALLTRPDEPITGLRTVDRGDAYSLSRLAARRYAFFVGVLWDMAIRGDTHGLTSRLVEPEIGNPVRLRSRGRLVSQDLANSVIEFMFAHRSGAVGDGARVAELGAGYGRLAYVYAHAHELTYCVFDIPPALAVAQWYLTETLGSDRIVPYAPHAGFGEIESHLTPGKVAFFTPDQLELFPDGWFGLTQTISTLPEMPARQSAHYLSLLAAKSARALFLKQWRQWRNDADQVDLREDHYALSDPWYLYLRRTDPVQPMFFNQLWLRS
ncbi:MAG: putative sugar O-methyltransferase [Solirubrobacteraceae bacterium]